MRDERGEGERWLAPRARTDRLIELARRIQGRPWNASGSEKTWVLDALREMQRFQRELRRAERVDAP